MSVSLFFRRSVVGARKHQTSGPAVYVDHNKDEAAYEDMRLMSHCHQHIIANSSFSWWAAWLNPSAAKVVISPKRWLTDTSVPLDHLLPDNWIAV